jgi:hypothetical protein
MVTTGADIGVPPLRLTQRVQLAQLHFRLTHVYLDSIPGTLFLTSMSCFPGLPPSPAVVGRREK